MSHRHVTDFHSRVCLSAYAVLLYALYNYAVSRLGGVFCVIDELHWQLGRPKSKGNSEQRKRLG